MRRSVRRAGDPETARVECYAAMKSTMLTALRAHYGEHPEWLFDDRGKLAVERSLEGLSLLYDVLDRYAIEWRAVEPAVPKTSRKGSQKESL